VVASSGDHVEGTGHDKTESYFILEDFCSNEAIPMNNLSFLAKHE